MKGENVVLQCCPARKIMWLSIIITPSSVLAGDCWITRPCPEFYTVCRTMLRNKINKQIRFAFHVNFIRSILSFPE